MLPTNPSRNKINFKNFYPVYATSKTLTLLIKIKIWVGLVHPNLITSRKQSIFHQIHDGKRKPLNTRHAYIFYNIQ